MSYGTASRTESGSWYLDPLAAQQKREANLRLVREAVEGRQAPRVVLKTDLFEEANGADELLFGLDLGQQLALGFDRDVSTCHNARDRAPKRGALLFVADARRLPVAAGSVDLIISTTLATAPPNGERCCSSPTLGGCRWPLDRST